jgi:hypothetical protein
MYVGFLKWKGLFSLENFFTILSNEKNSLEKNLNRQFKKIVHFILSTNVQNTNHLSQDTDDIIAPIRK